MRVIADLHIHSKYSRATSKSMDLNNLSKYAKIKGIHVLGTSDFTHPFWFNELKKNLKKIDDHYEYNGVRFIPSTEISQIYKQAYVTRKVHNLIFAPDLEAAKQITEFLKTKGRVDYDGRPIFGFPCDELVENVMSISKDCEVIPAHAWTPWFSVFGSKSGFDSMKECYNDQEKHIHALETGLSSDPAMNYRVSDLDKYTLISNSDAHSPWPNKLGREANVFEFNKFTYKEMLNTIRTKNAKKFKMTLEFFPEEGKYHYDGHRACNICLSPEESKKLKNVCPKCTKPLTIGVMNRVVSLADRPKGFVPENAIPYHSIIPLLEIISHVHNIGLGTKTIWRLYNSAIENLGNEFKILLDIPEDELRKHLHEKVVDVILKARRKELKVKPGYDGEYGIPVIEKLQKQPTLKEF